MNDEYLCVHFFPAAPFRGRGRSPFELGGSSTDFKDNLLREITPPLGLIPFSRGGKKGEERSLRGKLTRTCLQKLSFQPSLRGKDFETFFEILPFSFLLLLLLLLLIPLNYSSTNKGRDRFRREKEFVVANA